MTLRVRFASDGDDGGDVEMQFLRGRIVVGTVLDGTNIETTDTNIISGPYVEKEVVETTFEFYEPDVLPGDEIPFAIIRDGGEGNDDLDEDIYVVSTEVEGYFWH